MYLSIIILFLNILAGLCIGALISKRYRMAEKYFGALMEFVNHLMSAISFKKENVKQLIDIYKSSSKNTILNKQLDNLVESLDNNQFKIEQSGFLKKGQADYIYKFFQIIGKSDADTQMFEFKNYKQIFSDYHQAAIKNNKQYGGLYIKLGLLAGAALGILLM